MNILENFESLTISAEEASELTGGRHIANPWRLGFRTFDKNSRGGRTVSNCQRGTNASRDTFKRNKKELQGRRNKAYWAGVNNARQKNRCGNKGI